MANITGDGRVEDIMRAHGAALNLVQCSGATMELAKMMKESFGVPFHAGLLLWRGGHGGSALRVSPHSSRTRTPESWSDTRDWSKTNSRTSIRASGIQKRPCGQKAAIYVGGAFKAFSLVKAFRLLGMQVVLVGSQTGTEEDYRELHEILTRGRS